jgi:DNA-binding MarR family transcriptional regulator
MSDAAIAQDTGMPAAADDAGALVWAPAEQAALGLWTDLLRVTSSVHGRLADSLAVDLDLLPEEVDLLMKLEAAPEQRLRMVDVSSSLQLSKSGVTRLVDRLAERGLVERAPCPKDRRVVYAGLTEQGRRSVAEAGPIFVAGLVDLLGRRLSAEGLVAMRQGLDAILAPPRPA